jgi:hypothetical protein
VRGEVRRRQLRLLRESWAFFAVGASVALGLVAGAALAVHGPFLRGVILGAGVAATLAGAAIMVLMLTGTAATGMGAVAEQWTASEIRALKRDGWLVVNHLLLKRRDIDHVLIGPAGVIAVETKWSSSGWDVVPPSALVLAAIEQVKANAHDLERWHFVHRQGIAAVQSVLFLWTAAEVGIPEPGAPVPVNGVTVITGTRSALKWRETLTTSPTSLQPAVVRQLWRDVAEQTRVRDEHQARESPQPPSYGAMYWSAVGAFLAVIASMSLSAQLAQLGHWWTLALGEVAATVLGVLACRIKILRVPSLGWIAAAVFGLIIALASAVVAAA